MVVHRRSTGAVYALKYHLVWCPKYRRKVLVGAVEADLRTLLRQKAEQLKVTIEALDIMPDHVHLLIRPIAGRSLPRVLQGVKGYSGREINRTLGRDGSVWQTESFDHLIRNEADWFDKFEYIHNNPVAAGLVPRPQDYPFSSLVTLHSVGRLESLPRRDACDLTPAR